MSKIDSTARLQGAQQIGVSKAPPTALELAGLPGAGPRPAKPGHIDSWADLEPKRRGFLKIAVRLLERASGRPLGTITFDRATVSSILRNTTAAACNVSEASFAVYRSALNYILDRLDRDAGLACEARQLMPEWAEVLAWLPEKMAWKLIGFARFESSRTISPSRVTDQCVVDYLAERQAKDVRGTARNTVRRLVAMWNNAVDRDPRWPRALLTYPAADDRNYAPPFSSYPASFQADAASFEERLRGRHLKGLYEEGGGGRPMKPDAIKTRMSALKLLPAALVCDGMPIADITSLQVLLEPENLKRIMSWHYERAGQQLTDHIGVLTATFRVVARHVLTGPEEGLPGGLLDTVLGLLKKTKPPQRQVMTDTNMRRLRELDDPSRRARLLHLPAHLLRQAERIAAGGVTAAGRYQRPNPTEAARLGRLAAVVEILLHCPMRAENLSKLRIGKHLLRLDARKARPTHILVPMEEVKNDFGLEWPLQRETSEVLDKYMRLYRPRLPNGKTDWLFPGKVDGGMPLTKSGLNRSISRIIHEHVGVRVNLHLFRAFAGVLILRENPGALQDLRLVLGHKTMNTTTAYYMSLEPAEAAVRLGKLISKQRKETKLTAAMAFRKRRKV